MPRTTSVILSSHFEQFVQRQLATGRYSNASEVIRESLRQMEDRETHLSALRAELDIGIDQLDRGEYTDWRRLKAELDAG
ncbi:MAG: type II toxin-antitoxin system ParD family antitoxin [Xanthomonadales bacterium]|nr:type II toxin-antitoxin system ParD family antitoxin [Xanthomonadales bacterium]|tara:strand:- start:506 stop:745 length:240 start_codon:yes stop_codon:yes gene_type:complete